MGDPTLHLATHGNGDDRQDDHHREAALAGLVQRMVHHRLYGEYDDHDRALEVARGFVERRGDHQLTTTEVQRRGGFADRVEQLRAHFR